MHSYIIIVIVIIIIIIIIMRWVILVEFNPSLPKLVSGFRFD